jgi:Uma2 family endonuclease
MAVARRQFTVEDYHRMRDAGIFTEDDRVELLDGEVLLMSPIGPLHAAIVKRINTLLAQSPLGQYIVSIQDPIQLSDLSEPQPDIAILEYRSDFYGTSHPEPASVMLLMEVSDTSLEYDRENKLPRYAESGIKEVWIIDLENQQVEQYAHPANGSYRTKQTWLHGQSIPSHTLPVLKLQINDILG